MDGTALALKLADVAAPAALTERFPFAIVGHVDHGKSSLIGRLLHDTNSLPEGKFAELKAASDKRGGQFEWSFLLDALQAERDQGITIDTTQIFFQTAKRRYVIIDAPGHKEFLKNAISGVAQAQAAILVIDAAEGVREQTRRHALILQLLGLRQIAVAVNKVDLIGYDQARFDAIAREITDYLRQLKLSPTNIVPVSARQGDNIATKSDKMPWYQGPTVLRALDSFASAPVATDQPLRLPIQDVFKFDERRLVVGRIESGSPYASATAWSSRRASSRPRSPASRPGTRRRPSPPAPASRSPSPSTTSCSSSAAMSPCIPTAARSSATAPACASSGWTPSR